MAHALPPPAQMVMLLGGFRISQALYAAAALGVADHLVAGPAPAEGRVAGPYQDLAGRSGGVGYARLSSSTGMVRTPAVWRAYPAKPG